MAKKEKMDPARMALVPATTKDQFRVIEEWVADEEVWKWLGPPFTGGKYRANTMLVAVRSGTVALYLATVDGEPVGVVGLWDIDRVNKRANTWASLGDFSYAGRGVMRIAYGLLIDEAFETYDCHSVYGWSTAPNLASQGLIKSNGMQQFGVQREAFWVDGKFVDFYWYDMLRSEWLELRGREE